MHIVQALIKVLMILFFHKFFYFVFFLGTVLKFVQAQIIFFCILTYDFFYAQFIAFKKEGKLHYRIAKQLK